MNTPSENKASHSPLMSSSIPVLSPQGTFPAVFQLFSKPAVVDTFLENKLLPSGLKLTTIYPVVGSCSLTGLKEKRRKKIMKEKENNKKDMKECLQFDFIPCHG